MTWLNARAPPCRTRAWPADGRARARKEAGNAGARGAASIARKRRLVRARRARWYKRGAMPIPLGSWVVGAHVDRRGGDGGARTRADEGGAGEPVAKRAACGGRGPTRCTRACGRLGKAVGGGARWTRCAARRAGCCRVRIHPTPAPTERDRKHPVRRRTNDARRTQYRRYWRMRCRRHRRCRLHAIGCRVSQSSNNNMLPTAHALPTDTRRAAVAKKACNAPACGGGTRPRRCKTKRVGHHNAA
jgi:hypothetical protein